MLLSEKVETNSLDNIFKNKLFQNELYYDIIKSKTFKRLKTIHFLGAIDYLYKNKKRHTRYEHTLSVAKLALYYSELTRLKYDEEKYLVIAALLHDIGHGPLSHSMEPSFKKLYNLSHHIAGINIILGKSPLGEEIFKILKKHKIDIDRLVKLLDGKSDKKYAFALYNPINIDTIDGILRSYTYLLSSRNKNTKLSTMPDKYTILKATILRENQNYLDIFWQLKHKVYNELINKDIHIYADNYSQRFVLEEKNIIREEDFYLSEKSFKNKYSSLFLDLEQLLKLKKQETVLKLNYIKRKYKINMQKDISKNIRERYVYSKQKDILVIKQTMKAKQKTFRLGVNK